MDEEIRAPQSTVVSKPMIPLRARYLKPGLDASPSRYPDPYLSDNYLSGPSSFTGFGEQNTFDSTNRATDDWGVTGLEILHPQPRSIAVSANFLELSTGRPFLFHLAPEHPSSSVTTAKLRRTPNFAARRRIAQACDNCRGRKTKVRHLKTRDPQV